MRRLIASVSGVMLAVGLAAVVQPAAQAAPVDCRPLNVVVGGFNDPNSAFVPNVHPGNNVHIQYSAQLSDRSVAEGVGKVNQTVNAYRAACGPNAPVTLTGYSLGAAVVDDACSAMPTHDLSCVAYGNPRRPDNGSGHGGAMVMLPSFIPGFTHGESKRTDDTPIVDPCKANDIICNAPQLVDIVGTVNGAVGYLVGDHDYTGVLPNSGLVEQAPQIPGADLIPAPLVPDAVYDPVVDVVGDVMEIIPVPEPYVETRVAEYVPDFAEPVIPAEVLNFVPPPLPPMPVFDVGCVCLR